MNQSGFFFCSNCGKSCVLPLDNMCPECYTISVQWHCNCCDASIPSQFVPNHLMSALHVSMSSKTRGSKSNLSLSLDPLKLPSIFLDEDYTEVYPLSSQAQMKNLYNDRNNSKRLPVFMEEETNMDIYQQYNQQKLNDSCLPLPQSRDTFVRKSNKFAALSKLSSELLECEKEECGPVKPSKRLFSSVDKEEVLPFLQLPPLTPMITSSHTPTTPPLSPFQTLSSPPHKKVHLSSSSDYINHSSSPLGSESSPLSSPYVFSPINPPSSSPILSSPSTSTLDFPTFTPVASRPSSTSATSCWWKTNSNQTITDQGGHYFCVCNPNEKLSKTYNKGKCSKCHHHLKWWCDVCQKSMWWNGRTAHRASNAHIAGCKLLSKK